MGADCTGIFLGSLLNVQFLFGAPMRADWQKCRWAVVSAPTLPGRHREYRDEKKMIKSESCPERAGLLCTPEDGIWATPRTSRLATDWSNSSLANDRLSLPILRWKGKPPS